MSLPDDCLPHIKCSNCGNYLSYFPIHLSTEGEGSICGRCSELLEVDENYIRNNTYESLAQYLKFPCIYHVEGCIEKLFPDEVSGHEDICPYRTVTCALNCFWQGSVKELTSHVIENHSESLLVNGEFEMNILNSYTTFSYIFHEDEIFSVKQRFDANENIFECALLCYKTLENITNYSYEITMFNGSKNLSTKFPLKSAENFLTENTTKIDLEIAKKRLDQPAIIIGSIRIFSNDINAQTPQEPVKDIHLDLLGELECLVCLNYILPPIYQCEQGHSMCEDCKIGRTECPTCKQPLKVDYQNVTLTKVAELLTYPCRFSVYGCHYAEKPSKIKQHQKFCIFGTQNCPLEDFENCKWTGPSKDLGVHISNVHRENMLEIDDLIVFFDKLYFQHEEDQCFIKKLGNKMFRVHYRYKDYRFFWAVQYIGSFEEAKNFKFEIDIIDNTNNNLKLFLRNFCAPLTGFNETFKNPGTYVFVDKEQVEAFLTDQLNILIRITK